MREFQERLLERLASLVGIHIEACTVTSISPLTVAYGGATGILGAQIAGLTYTAGGSALALTTGMSKPIIFPLA